jgi:hypothetical protein
LRSSGTTGTGDSARTRIGLPHEHQNPFAGIVWDEGKVYQYFTGPPNNWDRDKTFHNVLRKLDPAEVEGSAWDPASIMEYAFRAGLIVEPEEYSAAGVHPPGTISEADKQYVLGWYPRSATKLRRRWIRSNPCLCPSSPASRPTSHCRRHALVRRTTPGHRGKPQSCTGDSIRP